MSRPFRAPALAVVLLGAIACQDYNFNPVGHCLIQPGTKQFTLSNVDSADILFVVDDSGSMQAEQARLAAAFDTFVGNLSATNVARAEAGLEPFGYHVAVTTTSVYWNFMTSSPQQTCSTTCGSASGQTVCCAGTVPARQPRRCGAGASCDAGTSCRTDCGLDANGFGWKGEAVCCSGADAAPPLTDLVPCTSVGQMCGTLERHYNFPTRCTGATDPNVRGAAEDDWPYPHGRFVGRFTSANATTNPRVLHFDKKLYGATALNAQGLSRTQLENYFKANVQVGTCGSGQEQALQAGRLAVQSAIAGGQTDTWSYDPAAPYAGTEANSWTYASRSATAPARWPNPNSKLVVVFVGDEDDCSSPEDPSGGVVMLAEAPGADACTNDTTKRFSVESFTDYFTSLGRPVAAGFIFGTAQQACTVDTCTPGLCSDPVFGRDDVNGAQAAGQRLYAAGRDLQNRGVEVVMGSICQDFGPLLNDIAEVVKPPQTLALPTRPAETAVTLLRIAAADGETRKLCGAPLPPGAYADVRAAQDTGADWWFTATANPGVPVALSDYPDGAQVYVYINPKGACRANPGETYSADYLGMVPEGGCVRTAVTDPEGRLDCFQKLGGARPTGPTTGGAYTCFVPPGETIGTCTCSGTGP